MTDNASEIDVTARSTIGKTTASKQISSRATKLGKLVEKGLSGLGENQIKGFLNNALLEIEGSLSDFEKDYDAEIKRFENLLKSRKATVTKAVSAGLVKVQYGKGQDFYAVDYAQMYNAFFEKVLKIVKATKSQGSSAILGQIQEHIHEMIGNDSLTDDDKALMNKLIQEMQALQKERAKIKVVEVGKPPEQKVTVEVKQEITPVTQEQVVAAVKEKQAAGVPAVESQSLDTETIKKLEADVARLQKEMLAAKDAVKEALAKPYTDEIKQAEAAPYQEEYEKKLLLWEQAVNALEKERKAQKDAGITNSDKKTLEEQLNEFRETQKTSTDTETSKPPAKRRSPSQPRQSKPTGAMSDSDADYVSRNREKIQMLDDAFDEFLSMQATWTNGIQQSIEDMLDGVRLASQEMVFVITAEIQKNIGGKLKTIGKQIEESFGAKSTSGVASIAGKLDTINTTLIEIKGGLIKQKYIQESKHIPKSEIDEFEQKSIATMISTSLNSTLAPIMGEVLGENSELNWQKWINLEGDVRKPVVDRIMGFNRGGVVPGYGDQDSVLAKLTPGELVLNPRRLEGGTFDTLGLQNIISQGKTAGLIHSESLDGHWKLFKELYASLVPAGSDEDTGGLPYQIYKHQAGSHYRTIRQALNKIDSVDDIAALENWQTKDFNELVESIRNRTGADFPAISILKAIKNFSNDAADLRPVNESALPVQLFRGLRLRKRGINLLADLIKGKPYVDKSIHGFSIDPVTAAQFAETDVSSMYKDLATVNGLPLSGILLRRLARTAQGISKGNEGELEILNSPGFAYYPKKLSVFKMPSHVDADPDETSNFLVADVLRMPLARKLAGGTLDDLAFIARSDAGKKSPATSDSVPALLTPGEWVINPRRLDSGTIDWEAVKARRDFALRIRNEPIEHLGIFTPDSPYDVIEAIGDQTSVMHTEEQIEAIKRSGGRWSAIHNHPTEYHGFQTVFPSHGDINAMTGGLYRGAIGAERFSIVSGDVLSSIVAPASWDERQEQHRTDWLKYRHNAEWKDADPLLNFSIHSYLYNKVLSERGVTESIKDTPELQRAFYYTLIQHKLKGFYGSIFNPESLRFLAGGTFDFAYEADAALKATSLSRKYKTESTYLNSLVADRSVSLAKDLLLQPMDKVIAYDTASNIAGAIGSFNRPTLTDSVLPIRGADRGAGWNMYVGELAALERGKGLGPTLISMALAKALKGPVGDLLTHIELKAIPFKDTVASYLKMGFMPVGEQNPLEPLIPMAANIKDFLSSPKVSPDVRLALPKKGIMSREHPALKDFSLTAFPYEVIDPVTAAGTIVPAGTRTPNIFKYLANGGPLMPGQTAVVGEEGPEMLVPAGRGFHVLNNKIFRAMGGMRFLKRGTAKAEQEQEPPFKASGVKWAPRYVTDIAGDIGDGIAYATAESLKDVISSEVGPEFRTAAGGFAKRINDATFDIAKGTSIGGVSSRAADAVDLLRLKGGKAAEMVGRFAASARYAVTGGLIFAHVLRMLTATSQIYQKGMQAVGRGWGYMLDMILLPILPAFLLVSRGFIAIGNFFRANPLVAGITAIGLFTAAITAAVYAVWKIKQDMERAAAAFERFSAAMEGREYIPPEAKKGFLSRIFGGVRNFGGSVFGRLFRKTPPPEPSGGSGTGSPEPNPEYRYGPIEQPSGQYPIPYEWGYRPRKTYEVGRHRAGGNYAEAYPTSPGNWATTYDENGNPVINKVYRVKRRIRHFLTGGLVGETGPAILHTGELVIPANVVRGGLPKFADGGVFGGGGTFSDFIGPIAAQFAGITAGGMASFLTNPAVQSVLSGMRVVSATIGSVLAPIALIGGGLGAAIGMAQKGIGVLGRVFSKGTEIQVETAVNVGRAQRNLLTLMNLQLMAVVGGIVALLAAIAAIKGPGEVGFDVAKLAAGLVNGLLQKWGQFVDDLIKGSSKFIDDFVKALIGKESFLTKLFERLFGKEAGFVPALIEKLIGKESFLGKFVDDLLKGAGSLTDEIIKKLIGEEGGFVSKIVEKLVGSEGGFIPKLIEKAVSGGGKVAEVVGGITSKAGSILGKAGEFLGLGKGAPFYAKGIKPTIGYIVGELIGGVLAQGAGAGAADSEYTGGMTGFRPDLAQGSTTTFGAGSAEFLMNFFPKLWPALTAFNLVGQYQYGKEQAEGRLPGDMSYGEYKEYRINVTAEKLAEWWDSTATSIKAVFDGMAGWWNTTWNGFTSAVSASIDGVISTITGMVDGITAAWNSVVSALTSFFTLDNLKQIVMGAVTGAGSTVSGVVGTIGGIVGDLIHFDNGGITTKEGIGMLHAAEAIVPLSSTSIGSTTNRSEQRSMQVTNYNTFEVKREDDFLLFQRFQQFMANEQRRYTL